MYCSRPLTASNTKDSDDMLDTDTAGDQGMISLNTLYLNSSYFTHLHVFCMYFQLETREISMGLSVWLP